MLCYKTTCLENSCSGFFYFWVCFVWSLRSGRIGKDTFSSGPQQFLICLLWMLMVLKYLLSCLTRIFELLQRRTVSVIFIFSAPGIQVLSLSNVIWILRSHNPASLFLFPSNPFSVFFQPLPLLCFSTTTFILPKPKILVIVRQTSIHFFLDSHFLSQWFHSSHSFPCKLFCKQTSLWTLGNRNLLQSRMPYDHQDSNVPKTSQNPDIDITCHLSSLNLLCV